MQSSPPGAILREPRIQELYEAVSALKPKLGRTLSTVVGKYGTCLIPSIVTFRISCRHACQVEYCRTLLRQNAGRSTRQYVLTRYVSRSKAAHAISSILPTCPSSAKPGISFCTSAWIFPDVAPFNLFRPSECTSRNSGTVGSHYLLLYKSSQSYTELGLHVICPAGWISAELQSSTSPGVSRAHQLSICTAQCSR